MGNRFIEVVVDSVLPIFEPLDQIHAEEKEECEGRGRAKERNNEVFDASFPTSNMKFSRKPYIMFTELQRH